MARSKKAKAPKVPSKTRKYIPWDKIRVVWESDANLNFADVARQFGGVTRQAVQRQANKPDDPWVKVKVGSPEIQQAIINSADERNAARPVKVEVMPDQEPAPEPPAPAPSPRSISLAIEARAEIIDRHRREANLARNKIYAAAQEQDLSKATGMAKLAKIIAEAVGKLHDDERLSWGLNGGGTIIVHHVIPPSSRDVYD